LVTGLRAQTIATSGLFEKPIAFLERSVPIFAGTLYLQTASLAPIETESLFHGKLFFLWLAKRPEEALASQLEKKFFGEKLGGKAGNSFKKID